MASVFENIARVRSPHLVSTLQQLDLVTRDEINALNQLKPPTEGYALEIPARFDGQRRVVSLLALAFAKGKVNEPVIPYVRKSNA